MTVEKCRNGHVRTAANTYVNPMRGDRQCKICRKSTRLSGGLPVGTPKPPQPKPATRKTKAFIRPDGLNWTDLARCVGYDVNDFFPKTKDTPAIKAAKKFCEPCPVRETCLREALALPEQQDHGIRGGTTQGERRGIRLRASKAAKAVAS